MKKFLKKHGFNICMLLVGIIGIMIVSYPTVSDYWNSKVQSKAIRSYKNAVENMEKEEISRIKLSAKLYNQELYNVQSKGTPTEGQISDYEKVLNINGDGIMGYIVIPSIDVQLPIYHGTEEQILQVAAGHSKISSLPAGGENTHAVLLGHRGLPSARLFNDLDQLVVNDYFEIHVLDEILYYQIYEVEIVEPKELNNLRIKSGEDLVTLVTCTPYGINTHRLLIHGKRMDKPEEEVLIYSEARKVRVIYVALVVGIFLWILAMIIIICVSSSNKGGKISHKERMRRKKILRKYR